MLWWLMFAASAACLLRWAWTGSYRRRPFAAAFVLAYACNLYRPRHMPHWQGAWLAATAVLLPLRVAILVEESIRILRAMHERPIVIGALACSCAAVVGILLHYMPLGLDFYSVVALRQYLQVAMMAWIGFLLLYERMRHGFVFHPHAFIVALVIADYAIAATFEERSGLANGFILTTPALRATVKTMSTLVLAVCFFAWAAALNGNAPEQARKPHHDDNSHAASAGHDC